MGKAWDSFVPHPDVWREVYRVLKPGGHALVFAGTRTQDLMTIALRLGGFEVRDVIEWLYFSGFPKSMDVAKALDRVKDRAKLRELSAEIKRSREQSGYTLRSIGDVMVQRTAGQYGNWYHRGGHMFFETGMSLPSRPEWDILRDVLPIKPEYRDVYDEAEREKVGEYEYKRKGDGTWDTQSPGGMFGAQERVVDVTAPATELARKWDGWGTALKPAHEPIIVVRKPLIGTVADNVEKHGTGAVNIDGCRIGRVEGDRTEYGVSGDEPSSPTANAYGERGRVAYKPDDAGRFPANCVTTDDDAFYSPYFNVSPAEVSKKASKRDRGEGNTHPTVKPTELMAWLVRLVTPPGGVTLDPFAGSGTTLVAAQREGFGFTGIEREPEYVAIIESRTGVSAQEPVAV